MNGYLLGMDGGLLFCIGNHAHAEFIKFPLKNKTHVVTLLGGEKFPHVFGICAV